MHCWKLRKKMMQIKFDMHKVDYKKLMKAARTFKVCEEEPGILANAISELFDALKVEAIKLEQI